MLDTVWALILPSSISIYYIIVARSFFTTSIPNELWEAAQIDGVGNIGYFFRIVLPLSKAIIAVVALWSAVGFSEKDSFTITAITSLINIAATVIGMTIIDRVGRKPMLLAGSVGMVVAQGGLTVLFGTAPMVGGSPVLGPVSGPLALVCANLFVVAFGVTWGTTSWVMLSEMFPNTMRGAGMAVGTATQWLSNFVVTVSFPVLLGINVGLVYGLFAFFAFVSFFFALKCMHETKGVALEDMRA